MVHQGYVHHGTFVHDQQVAIQRASFVTGERAGGGIGLQQAMDGAGSKPCGFREPFGCPPGRCTQQAAHLLGRQDFQDGIDQGRLADAGSAGDDQHPVGQCLLEGRTLGGSELFARLGLAPLDRLGEIDWRVRRRQGTESLDAGRNTLFGPLQRRKENQILIIDAFLNEVATRQGLLKCGSRYL